MIETVTKRSNQPEAFDVAKIKKCIAWASEGLDVNPIELEATVSTFSEAISTEEIQKTLVLNAKNLCSAHAPHWSLVAGRLAMMNVWKEVSKNRPTYNKGEGYDFSEYVKEQVYDGVYDRQIIAIYTTEQLKEAGGWIDFNYDLDYDIAGVEAWKHSYLAKGELPQEALLCVSLLLASVDPAEKRMEYARRYFSLLRERKISLATPFLANLRRPDVSLSSCFIIAASDDLDSIMDTVHDAARISKRGGGVGVNLSRLRAAGSWIKKQKGAAGGIIPFTKYFDVTATAVNQEGKFCSFI